MKQLSQCLNSFTTTAQRHWKYYLLNNWNEIIGDLKTKVFILHIKNDVLVLAVPDSSWLQELYILSGPLLESINQQLGHEYIKKIQFRNIEPTKHKLVSPQPIKTQQLCELFHVTEKEKRTLQIIKDTELRKELTNYLKRCHEKK